MGSNISVIIPNYNGSVTIGECIRAACASRFDSFEVVVVDDCSTDNSADIIRQFPSRLIRLDRHSGASRARNAGALNSSGDILFFIDADCVMDEGTLSSVAAAFEANKGAVIGGTYTPLPFDAGFFSTFQSVYVNYSELKRNEPDYIAGHAMVMSRNLFETSGGFPENFLPILEDVEFSHRLKRAGVKLIMDSRILVRHIFGYDLKMSLKNAFKKSRYWTVYSLGNGDLLKDSGTASRELKFTVFSAALTLFLLALFLASRDSLFIACIVILFACNLAVNRSLIRAFFIVMGRSFGVLATLYYSFLYPIAVGAGGLTGAVDYARSRRKTA